MHEGPPVGNGAAAALGVSAIAAPHSPAPATTAKQNRSIDNARSVRYCVMRPYLTRQWGTVSGHRFLA